MKKTTLFLIVIILISCTGFIGYQVGINSQMTSYNTGYAHGSLNGFKNRNNKEAYYTTLKIDSTKYRYLLEMTQ